MASIDHRFVTTAFDLPGHRIVAISASCAASSCARAASSARSAPSLQTLVGGNITLYTELCERAREDAFRSDARARRRARRQRARRRALRRQRSRGRRHRGARLRHGGAGGEDRRLTGGRRRVPGRCSPPHVPASTRRAALAAGVHDQQPGTVHVSTASSAGCGAGP